MPDLLCYLTYRNMLPDNVVEACFKQVRHFVFSCFQHASKFPTAINYVSTDCRRCPKVASLFLIKLLNFGEELSLGSKNVVINTKLLETLW